MATIGKTIIIAILASVAFIIILQVAFFFPFYMTMVVEAFDMANIAANDNYIKWNYYSDAMDDLLSRPMFNEYDSQDDCAAKITALHIDDEPGDAIELEINKDQSESFYNKKEGIKDIDGNIKPYRQRGNRIKIKVEAWYPLRMSLWGREVRPYDFPVSFSMTTTALKYYKDLELNE